MSVIDTLIVDRTENDVAYAQQLNAAKLSLMTPEQITEYLNGLKGAYNANDLNRVETAIEYLIERLKTVGHYLELSTKTVWEISEYVTKSDSERYLGNVAIIKSCFATPSDMPEVPTDLDKLTFQEANDIEQIILMVDTIITQISKAWLYSGDVFSGEV